MNNLERTSEFSHGKGPETNFLWQYVQGLDPETSAQLSKPSLEAVQVMEHNIVGMLGHLPREQFDVAITTNREHLGRLLASAMIGGYFLHNAEQRLGFERHLQGALEGDRPEADA
ncbi:MAG: DUF760 domain-containing protein [Spirulinaceae cyanobacterium SM2_1_0]|nr:DUF760 domain-containing protein [Spirulinaceae cyanobacterium SM2_1_0]